ncbi:hypothetical protein CCACVL1_29226 [Corchorus capsularis]|uniref:Uncharacterized protein n=1 Tax=Corchorus capsularis TaxID=210143 RepID=A0A1R3G2W1_COCAP|nr:hypothetical protein CCACVL1_29226 [Corchorus capsularis]
MAKAPSKWWQEISHIINKKSRTTKSRNLSIIAHTVTITSWKGPIPGIRTAMMMSRDISQRHLCRHVALASNPPCPMKPRRVIHTRDDGGVITICDG